MPLQNNLDSLPTELLHNVFSRCSKEDAMCGRLVNKTLEMVCNAFVFSHLNLGSFSSSIHKLDVIASSKHNRHVRSIHVFTDQLRELSRRKFEATLAKPGGNTGPVNLIPRETWPEAWRTYEAYRSDQTTVLNDPSLQRTLREAFASLPFLQEVTTSHFSYPIMMEYPWPGDDDGDDPQIHTLTFARRLIYSTGRCFTNRDSQMIASCLDAIAHRSSSIAATSSSFSSASPLRKLTLSTEKFPGPFLTPSPLHPGAVLRSEPERRAAIKEALKDLKFLRLVSTPSDVVLDGPELRGRDAERADELVDLLASCSELTTLELVRPVVSGTWNRDERSKVFTTPLSGPLFGAEGIVWPKLERLEYSGNVRSADFVVFMGAHAGTLRELKLGNVTCENVLVLLLGIRGRLKGLRRVEISKLFEWGRWMPEKGRNFFPLGLGQEVVEWLLGRGEEMPEWRLLHFPEDVHRS